MLNIQATHSGVKSCTPRPFPNCVDTQDPLFEHPETIQAPAAIPKEIRVQKFRVQVKFLAFWGFPRPSNLSPKTSDPQP